jgi:phage terminase large subunit-like protein
MDRVTNHAHNVLIGLISTGHTETLACKRHLNDMERSKTDDYPYRFDVDKANILIGFAESLTIAEGEEPKPLICFSFQAFIFGCWHGWVHKKTGARRFRTSYIQVARQNGKSIGNAVPALYYGNFDGYQYPQIYCTATKELQARIVIKECYKFINSEPELSGNKLEKGLFTIRDYKSEIDCNITKGTIKALGRDTETIDGFRPYFGSVDEYHKHKTNQIYKLLTGGTKKLKQCLISAITTAGFDLNSPCYELYKYCKSVLAGTVIDETQFVYICELDKGDDIWDESNWIKANPLWTDETLENLRADAVKAHESGGAELRDFMTKSLNMWVQLTDDEYLNQEHWAECACDDTLEDMRGRECILGLDLSSGGDLTSGCLEFKIDVDNERKYFIDSHSFIPSMRIAEHIKMDNAPYDMWVRDGQVTVTETLGGVKTDYKYILEYYKNIIKQYELKLVGIGFDPHNADAFLNDLEEFGVDCTEIRQSCASLNDATMDFKLEVDAHNVRYNRKNTMLTWSFVNANVVRNSFKEIKIDKDKNSKRIDPCDAVIDAHKLSMSGAKPKKSVYEERGMRSL